MRWVSALKDYMIVSDPQITVNQDSVTGEDYTVTFWYVKKQQTDTVNHQLQMPDGTYQTVESEKVNGNIGYYVTAEPNTYEGYNCVSTQYQRSGVVTSHADNEDGLVIDIHYDRQNPISISDYEGYYDGDSHGLTVNGKAIQTKLVKEQIEYSLDSSNWSSDPIAQKDVNDNGKAYTVYTRINTIIGDQKYYGSVETHSIWIKPRPVTIKAPDAEKTYDGTVLNTFGQPAEIIKDDTTSYGFVGDEGFINYYYTSDSQITAPGEQPNKIAVNSVKVDSNLKAGTLLKNYAITFEDGTLKITDREDADKYQLIITPNSSITTYDGKEQSVSGIQSSVFTTKEGTPLSGYTITGATFAASGTDAGTYSVKQTGELKILDADKNDVTNQFAVTVNQASLIINQRPVTIAADSQTWDYDGQPHSLPTSHVTENTLADGQCYTATVKADTADGTIQEQGESAINTISDVVIKDKQGNDVTKNYIIKTTIGTLRINAIDAAIVAHVTIANKTSTYNGEMQKFTDLEGKDYELSFSFAKPEDEIDTSGWHLINDGITTQRLTAGTSKAVFADPTNVKVVDKEGHEVTTAQLSVTQGSLTVSPAKITIKANSAQREYNGEVLTAQGYTPSGLQSKDTIGSIEIIGSQLKPGSSDNVITEGSVRILNPDYQNYDVTNSYQITLEKGTLTVTNDEKADRKITITAANSQKTYDGTPLTQKVFRIEGDLEAGDSIDRNSIKTIGSQTVVGTSENTIDSDSVHILNGDVDVTDAYTIEYKSGTLEVTKRAITLTGGSASKVYDGTPLTAPKVTLTGTLAQGDDFDLTPQSLEQVTDVTGPQGKENPVSKTFKIQTADGEDRTDCYEITYVSGRFSHHKSSGF